MFWPRGLNFESRGREIEFTAMDGYARRSVRRLRRWDPAQDAARLPQTGEAGSARIANRFSLMPRRSKATLERIRRQDAHDFLDGRFAPQHAPQAVLPKSLHSLLNGHLL